MNSNSAPPWFDPHAQSVLHTLQRQSGPAHPDAARLIAADAARHWHDFLRGLWLYQHHPAHRPVLPWDIVSVQQAVALKRLPPARRTRAAGPPVLLIPSLINSFHILDLHPEQSFARFLHGLGHDVYMLDWHHDPTRPLPQSIAACVDDHIAPVLATFARPPHVIGYCMGGTLSALAAQQQPAAMRSLTLMATPWDFSNGAWPRFGQTLHALNTVTPLDHVTAEWLQMLFWQRDPLATLRKFQQFAHRDMRDAQTALFVFAEDWLNSGIDLPASLLGDCATRWFIRNEPVQHDTATRLAHLPVHIVTAARDRLVPRDSAHALVTPQTVISDVATGHIGLFAGTTSRTAVWPHVQQFLASHNA